MNKSLKASAGRLLRTLPKSCSVGSSEAKTSWSVISTFKEFPSPSDPSPNPKFKFAAFELLGGTFKLFNVFAWLSLIIWLAKWAVASFRLALRLSFIGWGTAEAWGGTGDDNVTTGNGGGGGGKGEALGGGRLRFFGLDFAFGLGTVGETAFLRAFFGFDSCDLRW